MARKLKMDKKNVARRAAYAKLKRAKNPKKKKAVSKKRKAPALRRDVRKRAKVMKRADRIMSDLYKYKPELFEK